MTYAHVSEDGLLRSNDASLVLSWNEAFRTGDATRREWVGLMREMGATIIAPDDGWVDRKRNTITPPSYADRHSPTVPGDLIALGGPTQWRLVRCVEKKRTILCEFYAFEAEPVRIFP